MSTNELQIDFKSDKNARSRSYSDFRDSIDNDESLRIALGVYLTLSFGLSGWFMPEQYGTGSVSADPWVDALPSTVNQKRVGQVINVVMTVFMLLIHIPEIFFVINSRIRSIGYARLFYPTVMYAVAKSILLQMHLDPEKVSDRFGVMSLMMNLFVSASILSRLCLFGPWVAVARRSGSRSVDVSDLVLPHHRLTAFVSATALVTAGLIENEFSANPDSSKSNLKSGLSQAGIVSFKHALSALVLFMMSCYQVATYRVAKSGSTVKMKFNADRSQSISIHCLATTIPFIQRLLEISCALLLAVLFSEFCHNRIYKDLDSASGVDWRVFSLVFIAVLSCMGSMLLPSDVFSKCHFSKFFQCRGREFNEEELDKEGQPLLSIVQ